MHYPPRASTARTERSRMSDVLPTLLTRIRDGIATDADRRRARALVEADGTFPDDVRTVALATPEEAPEDAGALLALLGLDPLDLAGAGDAFAVEADVAGDVMAALGLDRALPITEAVASEAGTIDVGGRVMAQLGAAFELPASPSGKASRAPLPFVANNTRGFRWGRWTAVALAAAALIALFLGRG